MLEKLRKMCKLEDSQDTDWNMMFVYLMDRFVWALVVTVLTTLLLQQCGMVESHEFFGSCPDSISTNSCQAFQAKPVIDSQKAQLLNNRITRRARQRFKEANIQLDTLTPGIRVSNNLENIKIIENVIRKSYNNTQEHIMSHAIIRDRHEFDI